MLANASAASPEGFASQIKEKRIGKDLKENAAADLKTKHGSDLKTGDGSACGRQGSGCSLSCRGGCASS